MAAMLRYSPLQSTSNHLAGSHSFSHRNPNPPSSSHLLLIRPQNPNSILSLYSSGGDVIPPGGSGGNYSGGGGGGSWDSSGGAPGKEPSDPSGPLSLFLEGWRSRVLADPQFPFKVLMEELVGVTACVLGDMASRPNFGLNELDFVFSTLVVGSILNFTLMYLLAPTSAASSSCLPGLFASCPTSHMFEPGPYSLLSRFGTFVYKGATFAAVGFVAGLAGTALSNGLITLRKKMDPAFETPNKPPPTLLNSFTWALHMGLSSNLRYQTLNGVEFLMARAVSPAVFKTSVVVLRCLNNVLGGMSFVLLARLTGSQKAATEEKGEVKERLLGNGPAVVAEGEHEELQRGDSSK